jgi:glycosidase
LVRIAPLAVARGGTFLCNMPSEENYDQFGARVAGRSQPATRAQILLGCLALGTMTAVANDVGAPPQVARVEPPSWWAGHSHNPVRLLLTGKNLGRAHIQVPAGFATAQVKASADGRYLFADLHIPTNGAPGQVTLRVVNDGGADESVFALKPPLPRAGNFQGFTTDDVIYLAMTDRFANGDRANDDPETSRGLHDRTKARYYHGGDLRGVVDRLDYLSDLGITTLWLTPWYDNVNHFNRREKYSRDNKLSAHGEPITDYHGYGAVDFYAVEERFGDLQLLRELVERAHARGLKVVQDQVANHTGPYHAWVTAPPTPTWFNGNASNHLANSWQTWTIAASNPPPDKLKSTLEGWFINILPDLNQNDPETENYLIQNSLWWVGVTGLDAVRQDTLPYVPRTYWSRWTSALKREYPNLTILGEMWDGNPELVSFFQGGRTRFDGVDSGVEALFDFPLHNAIRDVFIQGRSMTRLSETLAADTNYVNPAALVPFLGLHDTSRYLHEPGATPENMRLAFTFLLTTRGTPLIYYGDEIAMRGGSDPDNRRDFPGGWPGDAANAFDPAGRTPEQAATHAHIKQLIALRRELEPLRRGSVTNLSATFDGHAFARVCANEFTLVALNNSGHAEHFKLDLAGLPASEGVAFSDRLGALGTLNLADGKLIFTLPPKSAAVFAPGRTGGAKTMAHETPKEIIR